MGRKRDEERLDEIMDYIQQCPNQRAAAVAQQLGLDNKTLQRSLAHLEARGDLLLEDDKGRLAWFGKRH